MVSNRTLLILIADLFLILLVACRVNMHGKPGSSANSKLCRDSVIVKKEDRYEAFLKKITRGN